jgi:hypothetical protein
MAFAVLLALKSRTHLSVHRIGCWPRRHCRPSEDAALFPGSGDDCYSRGGQSEGRLSCRQPRVYGDVGRPSLRALACPRPARWTGQGWRAWDWDQAAPLVDCLSPMPQPGRVAHPPRLATSMVIRAFRRGRLAGFWLTGRDGSRTEADCIMTRNPARGAAAAESAPCSRGCWPPRAACRTGWR